MLKKEFTMIEAASELNVSRQYVYRLIEKKENKKYLVIKNNVKYISLEGLEELKKNIKNIVKNKTSDSENKSLYGEQINFLKEELEKKDKLYNDLLSKKDTFYNSFIVDMRKRLDYFEEESLKKDKLLENMQVLLKEQKLLNEKKKKKNWSFFKKKK